MALNQEIKLTAHEEERYKKIKQNIKQAIERVNAKAAENPDIDIEVETDLEIIKVLFEENESQMVEIIKKYAQHLTEYADTMTLSDLKSLTDFIAKKSAEHSEDITPTADDVIQNINKLMGALSETSEKHEKGLNEIAESKLDQETAQQAAEMLAEMNRKSMLSLNERLNEVIKAYQEQTETILNQYLKDNAEGEEVPAELLTAFIEALMEADEEVPAAIYAAEHYLEKDQSGNLTPEAIEAAEIFGLAYEKAIKQYQIIRNNPKNLKEQQPKTTLAKKYEIKMFNEIPLFHSNIVNKLFGVFHEPLPIDGKTRDLASETEYYSIEAVNGKKLKMPLVIEASMENINELLEITGQTQFDFFVWCLGNKCWNTENHFFTTQDFFKLSKCDKKAKASEYMLKRYEKSIEKLSAIRLKVKTYDRNGNLKTEMRNMLTTAGETRTTSNNKTVTGYIMLAPPALNGFSLEMNPFYNIPIDLINYPTSGKQDRAVCISTFLIQRIELKKAELKKEQKKAYDKAIKAAKVAEKQAALNEHREINNSHLEIEKYYPKIYYKKYRAVIDVQELCEKVEETKEIGKNVKSKIVSETIKCLTHFVEKHYIKSFNIPAGQHNKTENIIIEIFEVDQELTTKNLLEKSAEN